MQMKDKWCDMQACALELLKPTGEVAAVAAGFDVIAFSSAPTSWAACYEGHLTLLEGASKPLIGRQNGRRAYRPNSASTGCMRLQVCYGWFGHVQYALVAFQCALVAFQYVLAAFQCSWVAFQWVLAAFQWALAAFQCAFQLQSLSNLHGLYAVSAGCMCLHVCVRCHAAGVPYLSMQPALVSWHTVCVHVLSLSQ